VADESGLNVVLATGVYTYEHLPQALASRSEDQIAEIFVHDIENGIQGTGIKAAFIKCAADEPGVGRTSRRSTAPPRVRRCRPAGRSWPTRTRRAARGSSR
jgi:phosphotriesterase-related protein